MHEQAPDKPLPRDGEPYPDDGLHRRQPRPKPPEDRRTEGVDIARILDEHFAQPSALPSALAGAFHDIYVPIHRNDDVANAAHRADVDRVRNTGLWLVRHATDRCSATVGLALLAAVGTTDDIPLIQTIGLLSHRFGPLATHALERLPGHLESLLWLADRVAGWGRVYAVEALCRLDDTGARPWLPRKTVDGDFLNGYFAGKVATVARLHEALSEFERDSELLDHTGRLLHVMTYCGGMGTTLRHYPHAAVVLEAHARHVGRLEATIERFFIVAVLAQHLTTEPPENVGSTEAQRDAVLAAYLSLLDREDWCELARAGLAAQDSRLQWLAGSGAAQLHLRAFGPRCTRRGIVHVRNKTDRQ
ncbi:hypothetical protein AOB60_29150 [Streptomyces noursei]|uniref:Uncharacterized protein n=1 Tax=Streptomyces noursei TaxID=1971 RepID=A0A2N8PF47_STRNR|nr:hypothetical protein AOB60_29150 [Streptomyces noursei]